MDSDVLRKRFMDTAIADVLRAVDGGAKVGAVALSLCVIDYLSYLRDSNAGSGKNRSNYERIVEDYLRPINPGYNPTEVYSLRCSLVHVYGKADAMQKAGLDGFTLTDQMNSLVNNLHLKRDGTSLTINADTLIADVIWAAKTFFADFDGDSGVESAADNLLIVGVGMQMVNGFDLNAAYRARPYATMHRALSELDSSAPTLDHLRDDVTKVFKDLNEASSA